MRLMQWVDAETQMRAKLISNKRKRERGREREETGRGVSRKEAVRKGKGVGRAAVLVFFSPHL
jgi:hypothetical protein